MQTIPFVLLVLLFVLVLLSIVAIVYLYIQAKNRERLALIERGMDPNLSRSDFWLQAGIIAAGASAGLILDGIIGSEYGPLMALLLAGGGLIGYNLLRKARMRRDY